MHRPVRLLVIIPVLFLVQSSTVRLQAEPAARTRNFLFTYKVTVTGLKPGEQARVWLPVPPSDGDQDVRLAREESPVKGKITTEDHFGNQIYYVQAPADPNGAISISLTYDVRRQEVRGLDGERTPSAEDVALYLKPDANIPIGGRPMMLLTGLTLPQDQLQLARVLYDVVNKHMVYRKDKPGWGRGDAAWACDSGFGNCTDFHSLFISLARSSKLPARFEMGFLLPEKRGEGTIPGYHCWARFKPDDKGWIPVDISEASQHPDIADYCFGNLTENRILFSTGRDLVLSPRQAGPPLNYFIYPYVEVAGQPWPAEKIQKTFTYQDQANVR